MPKTPRIDLKEFVCLARKGVSVQRLAVRYKRSTEAIQRYAAVNGVKVVTLREMRKKLAATDLESRT